MPANRAAIIRQLDIARAILVLQRYLRDLRTRRRPRPRRTWTRPWLLRRPHFGIFEQLLSELQQEDAPSFRNFLRMDVAHFRHVLAQVGPKIARGHTNYRKTLPPELRLALTLRFLATGDSSFSLSYEFRVARNTVSEIIYHTCEGIISAMMEEFLPCPTTPEEWKPLADTFSRRWNFHHCVAAVDGKHIAIRRPPGGGSKYYNYKGFHSIVLLALVDPEYRFLYIDVGAPGSGSDGGLFQVTPIRQHLESGTLGLPAPEPLPHTDDALPYFIVGDDAFPLRTWLMKPYPRARILPMTEEQRLYNYRLSRARRVVENAFGILSSR